MPEPSPLPPVLQEIRACRLCRTCFAATATGHQPRPVLQYGPAARLLIVGQAPGARVHVSGRPFTDRSGDRLRDWMAVDAARFYDPAQVAILPMAFCFPGYDARGADLPPPPLCARSWRARLDRELGPFDLTLLVGGHAQRHYLSPKARVTETVRAWRDHLPGVVPLPHPSWRNTAWLRKNPWFTSELLPDLRRRIAEVLT